MAQCPTELAESVRPIAQMRTLRPRVTESGWVDVSLGESSLAFCCPSPLYTPSCLDSGGTALVQEDRDLPHKLVSSIYLVSSQLLANICCRPLPHHLPLRLSLPLPPTPPYPLSLSLFSLLILFPPSLVLWASQNLSSVPHPLGNTNPPCPGPRAVDRLCLGPALWAFATPG